MVAEVSGLLAILVGMCMVIISLAYLFLLELPTRSLKGCAQLMKQLDNRLTIRVLDYLTRLQHHLDSLKPH